MIAVFAMVTFLLFNSGLCFPFNEVSDMKLKRSQKSHSEKVNLSLIIR